ncbi:MAG TPA: hypothetical protein VF175_04480, partial [Lacipirellula sp.]
VDSADLAQWKGDFGENDDSDADGDMDSDGGDFLIWQRNLGQMGAVPAAAAVPEPGVGALFGSSLLAIGALRGRNRDH